MRIILAEDELITRKATAAMLAQDGHEVQAFENGADALEAFDENPCSIVVTDWMMPKLSGIDLTRAIRERRLAKYTHVVIVTSLSLEERTVEAFEAGADDVLAKPVSGDVLRHRIRNMERVRLGHTENVLRGVIEAQQQESSEGINVVIDQLVDVMRRQRSFARCRAFLRRQLSDARRTWGEADARTVKLVSELEDLSRRPAYEGRP